MSEPERPPAASEPSDAAAPKGPKAPEGEAPAGRPIAGEANQAQANRSPWVVLLFGIPAVLAGVGVVYFLHYDRIDRGELERRFEERARQAQRAPREIPPAQSAGGPDAAVAEAGLDASESGATRP
ncbi:MAG: hypothetical protein OEY14_16535 [Myxococcales bacterium]|nr:hypothetical protein [Myxococcales bacterium]